MRPLSLAPLFAETIALKGVGAQLAKLMTKLMGPKVLHLLLHFPVGIIDRTYQPKIAQAVPGKVATMKVMIDEHKSSKSKAQPYRVSCHDETGRMEIVFFNAKHSYIQEKLPVGSTCLISGKLEFYGNLCQMSHPDYIVSAGAEVYFEKIEPVYPLTAGLFPKVLRRAIKEGLSRIPELPEWHDPHLMVQKKWPAMKDAFYQLHFPKDQKDLDLSMPARERLAYDEFLSNQLALALSREKYRKTNGKITLELTVLQERALPLLPFELTAGQMKALDDLNQDMKQPLRMLRLLQGDVGSGKTIVAFLAMLGAVGSGFQASLMAPTEILARQHFENLQELSEKLGVRIGLLTGRDKGKAREKILAELASGEIQILFGTHALFQEDVVFQNLGFVVIDEQHRFGVNQRLLFSEKGQHTDILVMTATPIPRTLTLTAYGDMDVTILSEKPPGRQPIETRSISLDRLNEVMSRIHKVIEQNGQAYWICPLVEESEVMDLAAAKERFDALDYLYKGSIGLVHGKMKGAEKDAVMADFAAGKIKVLVATTVIEVGINVPNATIMIIEHAERFGLSQLHQLRGRVGRGEKQSYCLLLYGMPLNPIAQMRIEAMKKSEDGFFLAEEDLRLRGSGDILGTRQSGFPEFKAGDLEAHKDLLILARKDVQKILADDPMLKSERGEALRLLLYLWERDQAITYLRSG